MRALLQQRVQAGRATARSRRRDAERSVERVVTGVPRYAVRREGDGMTQSPDQAQEQQQEREREEEAAPATVQGALTIGAANDPYENEAEATARRVVDGEGVDASPGAGRGGQATLYRTITPLFVRRSRALQRQEEGGAGAEEEAPAFAVDTAATEAIVEELRAEQEGGVEAGGPAAADEGAEGTVQARGSGMGGRDAHPATPEFESALARRRGRGAPLEPAVREFMESRFGADFSAVRIHRDSEADRLSRQIGARAFTHGTDIYFAAGHYAPERDEGRRLLAHELTHVVQQGGAREQVPGVSRAEAGAIRKADGLEKIGSWLTEQTTALLRGWLAEKANALLRHIPGFTLLTVIVGYNPVLGERVARTPRNLLEGVITLVPGGALLFDRLDKGGAIDEAAAWLGREIDRLGITLAKVKQLFSRAWDAMGIRKGIDGNAAVLRQVFGGLLGRILRFVHRAALKLKELAFKAVLRLVGAPVERIMGLLNKGAAVLRSIFENPVAFIRNLFLAVKQGVVGFKNNIGRYLKEGLIAWLTGAISSAGITLPERWDLKGVIHLVLQILGITYQNIRTKLARRLGERNVSRVERAVTLIRQVMTRGPIALWEQIKERLAGLKEQVMEGIRNFIIGRVVRQGVEWIIGMLNPAAGLIKLVSMLYNVVSFFIRNWERIVAFANSVFESVGAIAAGRVGAAARFIEQTLARGVPIIIGFLASLLRLGDMAQKIREIMMRIRRPIDRAIDAVVRRLVRFAKRLLKKLKQRARSAAQAVVKWWKQRLRFRTKGGESHTLAFEGEGRKATLMLYSQPKDIKTWLQNMKKQIDEAGDDSGKLTKWYREVDQRSRKVDRLISRIQGKGGDDAIRTELNALAKSIQRLLEEMESRLGPAKETKIELHGTKNGFGVKAVADPLTWKPGNVAGSPPSVSSAVWEVLKKRKEGGRTYYIRGHLINENLHGPGNTWKNLTPITQSANKAHENNVERVVKKLVLKDKKTLKYVVEAKYGQRSSPPWFEQYKRTVGEDSVLSKLVEAERKIPMRLECQAWELLPGDKKKAIRFPGGGVIENKIADSSVNDYQLEVREKLVLTRLSLPNPVPEGAEVLGARSGKSPRQLALDAYARLPGIGAKRAEILFEIRDRMVGEQQTKAVFAQTEGLYPGLVDAWRGLDFEVAYTGSTQWRSARA